MSKNELTLQPIIYCLIFAKSKINNNINNNIINY